MQVAAHLGEVDGAGAARDDGVGGTLPATAPVAARAGGGRRQPDAPDEVVAGAGRDDAQRHVGPGAGVEADVRHAVAADDDEAVVALRDGVGARGVRVLGRVGQGAGDPDAGVHQPCLDGRGQALAAAVPRGRVDHEGEVPHARSSSLEALLARRRSFQWQIASAMRNSSIIGTARAIIENGSPPGVAAAPKMAQPNST